MTTTSKPLVSSFAQFVQGDIKGGAHAHAYRISIIRLAIEQAFKGNYTPIGEASTLTEGKAKKARAYHAGFATFGADGIKKVSYIGALNGNDNKAAREEIAAKTDAACNAFFVAFDAVIAEKAPAKAKAEPAPAPAPAPDTGTEGEPVEIDADTVRHNMAVEQDEMVCKLVALVNLGMLTNQQWDLIAEAMQARIELEETASLLAETEAVA